MPRTLTDQEDAYYQRQDQIANFAASIFDDPKLSRKAKLLIKEKYPDLAIPDLDLRTEMEERFDKEKKEREDKERKAKEDAERATWQKNRTEAQQKYSLTDEAMKDLEKFMEEKFIGDYDVAASYRLSKEPKTSEPSWDSTRWHHDKQEGFAEIAKDPEAWGRDQIMGALHRDAERARNGR
jgi:hypothetical protein